MKVRGRRRCDGVSGCGKFYNQDAIECPHCGTQDAFSELVEFDPLHWTYDLETYPNVFTASFKHALTGQRQRFEISDRRNDAIDLSIFLKQLSGADCSLVGFNNVGFDYLILHLIMTSGRTFTLDMIYEKAQSIINTPWNDRFLNTIWNSDTLIKQIDLFKIHHYDNDAKNTSLKMLEFNMRSPNIEDLPFPPGTILTLDQIDTLIIYNDHDVDETEKFYIHSLDMINFRAELSAKYGRNFTNYSDVKIGRDYFVMELEKASPGSCYIRTGHGRIPRQTIRPFIHIKDVIFPYVKFERPEFQQIKEWFCSQVITETKGVFKDVSATVDGFSFDFGLGGIHGSIESQTVVTDDDYIIYDWDVTSYYPRVGIVNKIYPEHLGTIFCGVINNVYEQRITYKKGTPENAMLKLALNGGGFGETNQKHSPFYDPKYMIAVTVNGQLLLCMLAEQLIKIPKLQLIQANTDGLTVRCPRQYVDHMKAVCKWWEDLTCLQLESAIYSRMFIRDVNNYLAEYEGGELKNKGDYAYKIDWHQNHNMRVVAMAAEAALIHGQDVADFIRSHDDINDFMLCTKVGRKDRLTLTTGKLVNVESELQKICRYYVSIDGGTLTKISPPAKNFKVGQWKRASKLTDEYYQSILDGLYPTGELDSTGKPWDARINTLNVSKYEIRNTRIQAGKLVTPCNDISKADWSNINYQFYIDEVNKLVNPCR